MEARRCSTAEIDALTDHADGALITLAAVDRHDETPKKSEILRKTHDLARARSVTFVIVIGVELKWSGRTEATLERRVFVEIFSVGVCRHKLNRAFRGEQEFIEVE